MTNEADDDEDDTVPIVQVGEPVLREVARPIALDEIGTPELNRLIEVMRETMRAAPGVGLAAPQIGIGLAIAVIEDRPEYQKHVTPEELRAREREPVPFQVLINPTIALAGEPVTFFEGCLSVDGFVAQVARARAVRVDALDEHGREVRIDAKGWYARILQHEIDHLNGTLYIDRMNTRTFTRLK